MSAMKLIFFSLFFVPLLNTYARELPLSSQHYQPGRGHLVQGIGAARTIMEKAYGTETQDLEEFRYKHFTLNHRFLYGLSERHAFNLQVNYLHKGEISKYYESQFNLPRVDANYRGFESVDFSFKTRFATLIDDSIDQSISLRLKSGVLHSRENNGSIGRTDFYASYLFSFYHKRGLELFGALEAAYMGKSRTRRLDGEMETTSTYATSSLMAGATQRWRGLYLTLQGTFGLMTNYNITSPSYYRETDKGFFLDGQAALGYERPSFLIETFYQARSDIFNKIVDSMDIADPTIDYEWESLYIGLRILWKY